MVMPEIRDFFDAKHSVAQFLSLFFFNLTFLHFSLMIDVLFFRGLAEGREFFWLSDTFVEERGLNYLLTISHSVIFAIHKNSFCSKAENHYLQLSDGKTTLLKIPKIASGLTLECVKFRENQVVSQCSNPDLIQSSVF